MKFISFLRGINVSGQKKIRMKDLQVLYEALGFNNVITYIQSGNVVFDSNEKQMDTIKKMLEAEIKKQFGFTVPVEVIKKSQWKNVLMQYPFTDVDPIENGTKVVVTILFAKPSAKGFNRLTDHVVEPERLHLNNKILYLYCPNGYGKTKLSNTFIEKKLGVTATTRNWKTVLKLSEISSTD